ncbi:anti-sigma factor antagonist [Streptomyces albiaxialis]|uniref:Anti-sigma factor antagonist n=1 Tax=Streptomyces albiaxialis TaxID=329523 RepID=A0ABN2WYE2_9ACTN
MEYGTLSHSLNFRFSTRRISGRTVIEFHGELDIAAEHDATPRLDAATALPAPRIVLDLTHAEFLDCSGLRMVERVHRRVGAQGGSLRLVCPHPRMLWLLGEAGLDRAVRPVPTLAEALAP